MTDNCLELPRSSPKNETHTNGCRVWIVCNPTSGGGTGEKLLRRLFVAFRTEFGKNSVVEWKHSDIRENRPVPTFEHDQKVLAVIVRSEWVHHSIAISEDIVSHYILQPSSTSHGSCDANVRSGGGGGGSQISDLVVAIGGDGTLSEVVNGMSKATLKCVKSQNDIESNILSRFLPRLVYLAAGTGADFARLGYCSKTVDEVVSVISGVLSASPEACQSFRIDVGSVFFPKTGTRRFFVNECSVGISCDVILRCERYKQTWLRYLGGTIVFFAAALVALVQLTPIPMRLRRLPSDASITPSATPTAVSCPSGKDGRSVRLLPQEIQQDTEVVNQWVDFPASTIAFGNGQYFGGGMKICPGGDPTDQLFAVTAWYATFWPFILRLYGVYSGSHVKWGSTTTLEGKRFEVDTAENAAEKQFCEMDGELGEELPAVVEFMGNIVMLRPAASKRNA